MKFVFSTLITALFSGTMLTALPEIPSLPVAITNAMNNLADDANYKLIEDYLAQANTKSLIGLDICLEQVIRGIEAVNQNRAGFRDFMAPMPWLFISALLYLRDYNRHSIASLIPAALLITPCVIQEIFYDVILQGDKQLERIAQLRYAIKVAAVAA